MASYELIVGGGASQEVALAFGHHEDRTTTTHGYEPTREAAMAFAKSWRRNEV